VLANSTIDTTENDTTINVLLDLQTILLSQLLSSEELCVWTPTAAIQPSTVSSVSIGFIFSTLIDWANPATQANAKIIKATKHNFFYKK